MSTEGWPGPMVPSPQPRQFAAMSRTEVLAWANHDYLPADARFTTELVNTPDAQVAHDFRIATALAARLKTAVAGVPFS